MNKIFHFQQLDGSTSAKNFVIANDINRALEIYVDLGSKYHNISFPIETITISELVRSHSDILPEFLKQNELYIVSITNRNSNVGAKNYNEVFISYESAKDKFKEKAEWLGANYSDALLTKGFLNEDGYFLIITRWEI